MYNIMCSVSVKHLGRLDVTPRPLDGRIAYLWIAAENMFPIPGTHSYGPLHMVVTVSVTETGTHISNFNIYDK